MTRYLDIFIDSFNKLNKLSLQFDNFFNQKTFLSNFITKQMNSFKILELNGFAFSSDIIALSEWYLKPVFLHGTETSLM